MAHEASYGVGFLGQDDHIGMSLGDQVIGVRGDGPRRYSRIICSVVMLAPFVRLVRSPGRPKQCCENRDFTLRTMSTQVNASFL